MKHGEYAFKVRSYECGADGFATTPAVCNYLQEAASLNAGELGFSKSDFDAAGGHVSWVLARLAVKMARYPKWADETIVETFPRGGRRIVAWRDFIIKDARGDTLGLATSEWMLIDLASRKVAPIPPEVLLLAGGNPESVLGPEPFTARLRYPEDGPRGAAMRFTAQKSHIDLNGHVNNVHYVEWLLEPLDTRRVAELEIAFRSETFAGDEIGVETAPGPGGSTYHRVFAPDGRDHVVALTR